MSKQLDAYWCREVGKELTCKCGRIHYKERRPKSNMCKHCLAERSYKELCAAIDNVKRKVFDLVNKSECNTCGEIKPHSSFSTRESRGNVYLRRKCKYCYNEYKKKMWKENEAYRQNKLDRSKEYIKEHPEAITNIRASRSRGIVPGVKYRYMDVFKRDKWRCYLCNIKVQRTNHLADNAAQIDHIIPLSRGGKDIPSNVKCCCRKCNATKSNKILPVNGNLFCVVDE